MTLSPHPLSDLGDDIEDVENTMRFEEAARAGAEAEQHTGIKPDRYENGVPIFTPVCNSLPDSSRGLASGVWRSGLTIVDYGRV